MVFIRSICMWTYISCKYNGGSFTSIFYFKPLACAYGFHFTSFYGNAVNIQVTVRTTGLLPPPPPHTFWTFLFWDNPIDKLVQSGLVPLDCSDIHKAWPRAPSGVYRIYPAGGQGHLAYCDMTLDVGGWTVRIVSMDYSSFNFQFKEVRAKSDPWIF